MGNSFSGNRRKSKKQFFSSFERKKNQFYFIMVTVSVKAKNENR